ncbi:MAG TPA: adenylate/guanylate cyclase domain-containing protein [Chryseolinea sp.]
MRAPILILGVLILFCTSAKCQDSEEIEDLMEALENAPEDSVKVNGLIELSKLYTGSDLQSAIKYGTEAKDLAEKIGFQKGLGYAYKAIAIGYFNQSNYPEALIQYEQSLKIFEGIPFKTGIANLLSNIGVVYSNLGDDTKAIEHHLKSLKVAEEIRDSLRIGTSLNNLGVVYKNRALDTEKSLRYFLRAYTTFEQIGYQDGIGTASMNLGEMYKDEKKYESAIFFFDKSLDVYRGTIDATFPLGLIGEVYAEQNEFEEALIYQNKALEIATNLDAKYEMTQSLLKIGQTQTKKGSHRLAISSYKEAEKIANAISAKLELKQAYDGLSKSYSSIGDFRTAYNYEKLFSGIKDTLYNTANDKKVQQLQFNFDIEKKQAEIDLLTKDQALRDATIQRQKILNIAAAITGVLLFFVILGFYRRYRYIRKTNKIIKNERDRSKELLLNILPEETARELETSGFAKTRYYESVTVLFTDFKGFSSIAGKLSPQALVAELNDYFGKFDEIVDTYGLEKIKTIGDAYMCAGGIPIANDNHPLAAVNAALAMQEYMRKQNKDRESRGEQGWELRVGIHTGPIVAGVVGKKKYAYDIWGDTVNIASRMESSSEPGKVNISSSTYNLVKGIYNCTYRGKISAKNIGEIDMYFVEATIEKPKEELVSVIA